MRIVLGLLGEGEHEVWGLRVSDEHGRDRAWIIADGPIAEVGLDHDGDTVAAITVDEWGTPNLSLGE